MLISNFIWAIVAAIVTTLSFLLVELYAKTKRLINLILVVILETFAIYAYYKSLSLAKLSIMNAIINGLSVILGAIIGIIFLKERISILDIIGIIIIFIGILLVK